MTQFRSRRISIFAAFAAWTVMALGTGCASGGYKLTREYARWVNSQNIILRIILYLLTAVVFAVTLLIDAVIFNTMDFWEGRVSEGSYQFKDGDKTFQVRHEILPESKLKRSTIQVIAADKKQIQEVVFFETPSGQIEVFVDGRLRASVRDVKTMPVAYVFDAKGGLVEKKLLWFSLPAGGEKVAVQ